MRPILGFERILLTPLEITMINSWKSFGIRNWTIFFSLFIDLNTMPPALSDVQRPSVEFSVPNAEFFSAFHQFLPHVQHLNALPVAFSQNFYHFGYHCYCYWVFPPKTHWESHYCFLKIIVINMSLSNSNKVGFTIVQLWG